MARLLRIALLSLLLVGLSFQGAWAGAFQCPEGQDMHQIALEDISSVVADMQHEPETGDMALNQDCGAASAASCNAMALLPPQPSAPLKVGSAGTEPTSTVAAVLFLTDGQDRPPRIRHG